MQVVFGTGPLGLAVLRELGPRENVRVVNRKGRAGGARGIEVVAADAADPEQARRAAEGATVVYHCASPPYERWPELHPPLMAGIIEGAAAAGAKLVFGDNLYMYGPVDGPLTEELPYRAAGPNGRTRARIAEMLMAAHAQGRVRAAIGRGSDFFGPGAWLSLLGARVVPRALRGQAAQVIGDPDQPHTVTYIEDFGRALVALGEREEALGHIWHVPNPETASFRRLVEMVFEEADRPARLRVAPRWGLALAATFSKRMRAVREQLYQVERPWMVDSTKFERAFGIKATPLREAIRATVEWFRDVLPPAR